MFVYYIEEHFHPNERHKIQMSLYMDHIWNKNHSNPKLWSQIKFDSKRTELDLLTYMFFNPVQSIYSV